MLLYGPLDRATLESLIERMHHELSLPLDIDGALRMVSASIGVTEVSADDDRGPDAILRAADTAMYRAKVSRQGTHSA